MWEEDMEQLVYIDVHTRNVGRWDVGTGRGDLRAGGGLDQSL